MNPSISGFKILILHQFFCGPFLDSITFSNTEPFRFVFMLPLISQLNDIKDVASMFLVSSSIVADCWRTNEVGLYDQVILNVPMLVTNVNNSYPTFS